MEQFNNQILKLSTEQRQWFLSFKPLFKLSQNYDMKLYESLIEDIDRKAFKRGYLDVIILLDSI